MSDSPPTDQDVPEHDVPEHDAELHAKIAELHAEVGELHTEVGELNAEVADLHVEVDQIPPDVADLRVEVEHLHRALDSSRDISAAVGIVMERLKLRQEEAFAWLTATSQRRNVKLRQLADGIVESGELPGEADADT